MKLLLKDFLHGSPSLGGKRPRAWVLQNCRPKFLAARAAEIVEYGHR
jgi:hypothetical protein